MEALDEKVPFFGVEVDNLGGYAWGGEVEQERSLLGVVGVGLVETNWDDLDLVNGVLISDGSEQVVLVVASDLDVKNPVLRA